MWWQVFNDLYKVKREDTSEGADLSPSPLLSYVGLQLDHIPLRERQFVTMFPLKVEPGYTPWTTLWEATIQTSGYFMNVLFKRLNSKIRKAWYLAVAAGGFVFREGRGLGEFD